MTSRGRSPWSAASTVAARNELRELMSMARRVVFAAAITGVVVGVVVGVFDRVVDRELLERLLEAPVGVQMVLPGLGLVVSVLALRWIGAGASPATTDEYLRAFHGLEARFDGRAFFARMVASAATLGSGGALGFEGPSVYFGTGIGHAFGTRVRALLARDDVRLLLVAGAAAGVGAIFRAPATGAVFAIEVPFRNELARRSLLPALVGAASGYLAFVAINGTEPLFPVAGATLIDGRDLVGAALVGITCGAGARMFGMVIRWAKGVADRSRALVVTPVAAVLLGGLVVASHAAFDGQALTLGPGLPAIEWVFEIEATIWLLVLLGSMRVVATAATVAGSGTGGLFVPLVVQGAITGQAIGVLIGSHNPTLYPVLGIAAFLGAGYRVPLAAVMFVAEATGRPGFVVPGLVAAVFGQILAGSSSVTAYQRDERLGHLERRAGLPISTALITEVATTDPDDSLAELFTEHVALARRRAIPVVEGERAYRGMVLLDDVLAVESERWMETSVSEVMRTDLAVLDPDTTVAAALTALSKSPADHLAVVDPAGQLYGLVSQESILDLGELMDRLDADDPSGSGPR
ncbi:MAG: chloride channel protein [Acidimicrobiales bacterium]